MLSGPALHFARSPWLDPKSLPRSVLALVWGSGPAQAARTTSMAGIHKIVFLALVTALFLSSVM
jgi:hypothetical protein